MIILLARLASGRITTMGSEDGSWELGDVACERCHSPVNLLFMDLC
jgi:hypothetical protein